MIGDGIAAHAVHAALDALALQQRVTATNIANVNTPYYTARRVEFKDALREAIADADVGRARPTVLLSGAPAGLNANNVRLEQELNGTTGLHYQLMVEALTRQVLLDRAAMK